VTTGSACSAGGLTTVCAFTRKDQARNQWRGAEVRQRYFIKVRDVVHAGIDAGEFRTVDADLDTLLMFGSAQWAWTWFQPTGSQPVDRVAGSFVDLVLGGLLVDRRRLEKLTDADGIAARLVREALEEVATTDGAAVAAS
jgi:hypothetical protein